MTKVIDLKLVSQSKLPAVMVEAAEAREDSTGRLVWSESATSVYTGDGSDPRRFDSQIIARYIRSAADWAAFTETKRGRKLAKKLRKLLARLDNPSKKE